MRSTPYELFSFPELYVWVSGHPLTPLMEISRHFLYIYITETTGSTFYINKLIGFIVYVYYIRFYMFRFYMFRWNIRISLF